MRKVPQEHSLGAVIEWRIYSLMHMETYFATAGAVIENYWKQRKMHEVKIGEGTMCGDVMVGASVSSLLSVSKYVMQ